MEFDYSCELIYICYTVFWNAGTFLSDCMASHPDSNFHGNCYGNFRSCFDNVLEM